MKIICDTDVMIDYWDARNKRHKQTAEIIHRQIQTDNMALAAITKMELLTGAANKNEMTSIAKKLAKYNILLINNEITLKAFDLLQNYSSSHGLQLADGLIAATAIITGLELFTYNLKDYRFITGLKLFKPL